MFLSKGRCTASFSGDTMPFSEWIGRFEERSAVGLDGGNKTRELVHDAHKLVCRQPFSGEIFPMGYLMSAMGRRFGSGALGLRRLTARYVALVRRRPLHVVYCHHTESICRPLQSQPKLRFKLLEDQWCRV